MLLPYGATESDFVKCRKLISELVNDQSSLDEKTVDIMSAAYSTGGDYSEETILEYAKAYLKIK